MGRRGVGDSPRRVGRGSVPGQKREGRTAVIPAPPGQPGGPRIPWCLPIFPDPSAPKQARVNFLTSSAQRVGNQREKFKLSVTNTGTPSCVFHGEPGSRGKEKPTARGIVPEAFSENSKKQGTYETTARNTQLRQHLHFRNSSSLNWYTRKASQKPQRSVPQLLGPCLIVKNFLPVSYLVLFKLFNFWLVIGIIITITGCYNILAFGVPILIPNSSVHIYQSWILYLASSN